MKKMTMLEYLASIDKLSKDNFIKMVNIYGYSDVCSFLNTVIDNITNNKMLKNKDKKELLSKFDYFVLRNKKSSEEVTYDEKLDNGIKDNVVSDEDQIDFILECFDKEYDCKTKEVDFNLDTLNLYLNDIGKYPLLTEIEEKRYGKDLKLIDHISIFTKKKIGENMLTLIDLEKIFLSIDNDLDREYVISILSDYCRRYARKESDGDKVLEYYLFEYDKLFKKLGRIPNGDDLNSYFSNLGKYNVFNDFGSSCKISNKKLVEEVSMCVKYMIARNMMINCNLRLVVDVAKKYYGYMDFLDLISEGNCGLIKAVMNFDVDLGNKFSTYATKCIKRAIIRGIDNGAELIRKPVHFCSDVRNFVRKKSFLEQQYGRELTVVELAKNLGKSVKQIEDYIIKFEPVESLEQPIFSDRDDFCLLDVVSYNDNVSFSQEFIREKIDLVLSTLTERERKVITCRFGLGSDNNPQTLKSIGRQFGVSRQCISGIEAEALSKLRRKSCRRQLENFID